MEQKKKKYRPWFMASWAMSPEELKSQVDNYRSLKITKSYRGIVTLIFLVIFGVTILLSFFVGDTNALLAEAVFIPVVVLPLLYFTYGGHRWAIALLMVFYTINIIYNLSTGSPFVWGLIFWIAVMPYCYKALQVENARRSLTTQLT